MRRPGQNTASKATSCPSARSCCAICRSFLQSARDGRAVDQGRQGRHPLDASLLPPLPRQRGPPPPRRHRLQPRQSLTSAGLAARRPELVADESPAAALQDGRPAHPACPVLHLATRRKPLDEDPPSADSRAHRATRRAPHVIGRTEVVGHKGGDAGRSVFEAGPQPQEARGRCAINGAGARNGRCPEHEWPDRRREASRGSLSSTKGTRTWSISEIPVEWGNSTSREPFTRVSSRRLRSARTGAIWVSRNLP